MRVQVLVQMQGCLETLPASRDSAQTCREDKCVARESVAESRVSFISHSVATLVIWTACFFCVGTIAVLLLPAVGV